MLLIMALQCSWNLCAQEGRVPGSAKDLATELGEAHAVFVGHLVSQGIPDLGPTGAFVYQDAELVAIDALKGELPKQLRCSYTVRTYPPDSKESLPDIGKQFIIMGGSTGNDIEIRKVLVATPENLALVRNMLRTPAATVERKADGEPHNKPDVRPPADTQQAKQPSAMPATQTVVVPQAESTPWLMWLLVVIAVTVGSAWVMMRKSK